jgi:periplasmic copper chaperone A
MRRISFWVLPNWWLLLGAIAAPSYGQSLVVNHAWVQSTVAAQSATGAFMDITSRDPAVLISVSSPVAATVEIHEMRMDGDVMKMRELDRLELPAGKTVKLAPGAYHLMLLGLKRPLQPGASVPFTLNIESAGGKRSQLEFKAQVRSPAS